MLKFVDVYTIRPMDSMGDIPNQPVTYLGSTPVAKVKV